MAGDAFALAGRDLEVRSDDSVTIHLSLETPAKELMKFNDGDLATRRPDDHAGQTLSSTKAAGSGHDAVVVEVLTDSAKIDEIVKHPHVLALLLNEGSVGQRTIFHVEHGGIIPRGQQEKYEI